MIKAEQIFIGSLAFAEIGALAGGAIVGEALLKNPIGGALLGFFGINLAIAATYFLGAKDSGNL